MAKKPSVGRIKALVEEIVGDLKIEANITPKNSSGTGEGTELTAAPHLGSADNRWNTLYIGDLNLENDRGSWLIIEEEEYLSIRNKKNGKLYKFVLEEIPEEGE